jgi:hypothetical protein
MHDGLTLITHHLNSLIWKNVKYEFSINKKIIQIII